MRFLLRIIFNSRYAPLLIILLGVLISYLISCLSPKPKKGIEVPKPTPVFFERVNQKTLKEY